MKKTLWMLGVAVTALTSCTQSEVLDVPESKPIEFESFVNKETRATISTTNDLTKFYVFGANTPIQTENSDYSSATYTTLFTESELNSPAWTHTNPSDEQAWANNRLYRFAAYTNGNLKCEEGVVNFDPKTKTLTFTNYAVEDHDLIAAVTEDRPTDENVASEQKVGLNFQHMLSRIRFTFTNSSTTNKIKVEDITMTIFKKSTGTINDQNSIEWAEGSNSKEDCVFSGTILNVSGNTDASYQVEHYVIPQNSEISVLIKYHTLAADESILHTNGDANNGEIVSLSLGTDQEWLPGNVYNYTATLNSSTKKIEFYVHTIKNWENQSTNLDLD